MFENKKFALEAVNGWSWDFREDSFWIGLEFLKLFVQREGHALVPYVHIENGFKLGRWVNKQRNARLTMPENRNHALEAVNGWIWNVHEDSFWIGLEFLKLFAEREGHARIPYLHIENGFKLWSWVSNQRNTYLTMPENRKHALEAIEGWVWKMLTNLKEKS